MSPFADEADELREVQEEIDRLLLPLQQAITHGLTVLAHLHAIRECLDTLEAQAATLQATFRSQRVE